jgi:proteasome component ECM29
MKNIWKTLVKDPPKTVDSLFDEIMKEVLSGLGDRMWRTREARFNMNNLSCNALADLLNGRQLSQIENYMKELWSMCFRALDDIKESVRKSAFLTAKSLTRITVRYCNPTYIERKRSQKLMDEMIPFLLHQGLGNMAEEVREFSLVTILKLCKTSGILLTPHVSDIVCTFLESLSSLEPQAMNYLSFHADDPDGLDSQRISAAKSSPIMEAIDQCCQYLNATIMESFVPKLCTLIKKGVGLPTKAGTARMVYMLVLKLPVEIEPHSDSILKALTVAIFDRNATVRKAFSSAVGYICKFSSDAAVKKLTEKLAAKYLESEDEKGRLIAPITFLEMARHSTSKTRQCHHIILPLAFMGARDTSSPTLQDIWGKVWEENTGGTSNAIKKWKAELFETCSTTLQTNSSWTMKKQVGKAITDMAKALNEDIITLFPDCLNLLIESLIGRTWEGKEAVLEALAVVCEEGSDYFLTHPESVSQVETVMIREIKKQNFEYVRYSIQYLGIVFDAIRSRRFDDVKETLSDLAYSSRNPDDMDVDESKQKPLELMIQANSFKAIAKCFPHDSELQGNIQLIVSSSLDMDCGFDVAGITFASMERSCRHIRRPIDFI